MNGKAICCGSFDPITRGHEDVIRRAAALYESVTVIVAKNPDKKSFFTPEDRVRFCEQTLKDLTNVSVIAYDGIIVEYAREHGIGVLVKGLRNPTDFEYEHQLEQINRMLAPEIETVYLSARPEYTAYSSTYARELIRRRQDLTKILPAAVIKDIKKITERM